MRILFWSDTFHPSIGGVEVFSSRLLPALAARGHEFLVVTTRTTGEQPPASPWHGIPVHRFPFEHILTEADPMGVLTVRREVASLKQRFAPHLVHVNSLAASTLFHMETSRTNRAPTLLTVHGNLGGLDTGAHAVTGRMLRSAAHVNCCSEAARAEVLHALPELADRMSVVYYGQSPGDTPPTPRPVKPPRLLCIGRLVREKGFDVALDAFAAILQRVPSARLTIAGDGPVRSELERRATALHLGERVRFTGWVRPDEIAALLDAATLVMVPSLWQEAFGLVAMEAALRARPVVAARVGGLPEAVVDGTTGILFERGSSDGLSESVATLLEDPQLADQMGRAARRRAVEVFAWPRCVDAYEALYRRLTEESGDVGADERPAAQ